MGKRPDNQVNAAGKGKFLPQKAPIAQQLSVRSPPSRIDAIEMKIGPSA